MGWRQSVQFWCLSDADLLLPAKSEPVEHKDLGSQENSSDFAVVQSDSEEVQGAAPVHWRASHVEGEAGDRSVHEDTEVVTQVCSGHTKGPHARKYQDRADSEQNATDDRLIHRGVEGLVCQGQLVHVVTKDPEGENRECKSIAAIVSTPEDAGQEVVAVLCCC